MSKYIIRNCPANKDDSFNSCVSRSNNQKGIYLCQDCTDCLLKQIVERCREAQKEYPRHFSDGESDMFVSGRNNLAGNILALLDIQEVE